MVKVAVFRKNLAIDGGMPRVAAIGPERWSVDES
jgi:hypothetical protein